MDYETRYRESLDALAAEHGVAVESRYLTVDVPPVERVHTLVAGEGPPLLLLHGVGVGASSWMPLLADLAEDYTCYALDRPGRGLSDVVDHTTIDFRAFNADLLSAAMDELGLESVPVVGNSFGGLQALMFAIDRPERVASLALLGAPGGLSADFPLRSRLAGVRWLGPKLVSMLEPDDVDGARDLWGEVAVVDEDRLSEVFLTAYLAELEPPGRTESLASVFRDSLGLRGARPDYLVRDEVATVDHPTLFLWGTEDQYFGPEVGRPAAAEMPNARFLELDGLGHAPWLEGDERPAAELRSFLSSAARERKA